MPFSKNHSSTYDKSEFMVSGLSKDRYRQRKSVCFSVSPNSTQYWQDNAYKNNYYNRYSIHTNEHSPKESDTSFTLKNVVFDKTL